MTITKPNGDVITCTVEEYKQLYKQPIEYINVPSVWVPDGCRQDNYVTKTSTSTSITLDEY